MAIINESRQTSISLGLRVVNFRCGGRQRYKGARLSKAELWGMLVANGWCHGKRCAWLSSLYKSWVLVTCIASVVIVIGVHGMVSVTINLYIHVLMPSLQRYKLAP